MGGVEAGQVGQTECAGREICSPNLFSKGGGGGARCRPKVYQFPRCSMKLLLLGRVWPEELLEQLAFAGESTSLMCHPWPRVLMTHLHVELTPWSVYGGKSNRCSTLRRFPLGFFGGGSGLGFGFANQPVRLSGVVGGRAQREHEFEIKFVHII